MTDTTNPVDHKATLIRLRLAGLPERIVCKLKPEGRCLVWSGARNSKGYGQVRWEGRSPLVHRLVFATLNGPIPVDLGVLHHCDNPPCAAPADLFLGTQAENLADMTRKGRRVNAKPKGEAHGLSKITQAQAEDIRKRFVPRQPGHRGNSLALSAEYGLNRVHLWAIATGRRWDTDKPVQPTGESR